MGGALGQVDEAEGLQGADGAEVGGFGVERGEGVAQSRAAKS